MTALAVWRLIWGRYAAVVGSIVIVAVWAAARSGSAVIAGSIIGTRSGSADRSSTDSGGTDADRHSWAYTTVYATAINTAAVDTATIDSAICGGVSCNGPNESDTDNSGCSERENGST
jgi:hypothetical protein